MSEKNTTSTVICMGETLIDFIAVQKETPIYEVKDYHRNLGGSPTNVAVNLARLGFKVSMVASVGDDGFGQYIVKKLKENEVDTQSVQVTKEQATTVIFVSSTQDTPEFIAMRGADCQLNDKHITDSQLGAARLFHTTCFALSKQPAQDAILATAKRAKDLGCQLSIDLNYAAPIWPDREEALVVVEAYCKMNPLVKVSKDDIERLFGAQVTSEQALEQLHAWGANIICLTLGKKGAMLSQRGADTIQLAAPKIEKIMDATGAGDAFWSGFLFGFLKNQSAENCMAAGLQMAAIKLQNVGRIPDYVGAISSAFK